MDSGEEEASEGRQDSGGGAEEDKKTEKDAHEFSLIQVATDNSIQDAIDHAQQTHSSSAVDSSTATLTTADKTSDVAANQATALLVVARDSDEKVSTCHDHDLGEGDNATSAVYAPAVTSKNAAPNDSNSSRKHEASSEGDRKTDEEPKRDSKSSSSADHQAVSSKSSSPFESGVVEGATGSQADAEIPSDGTLSPQTTQEMGVDAGGLGSSVTELDMSTVSSGTSAAVFTADYEQQCNLPLPEETDCPDHPGKKTTVYCEKCKKKICIRCVMGDHRQHEFMPFEDKIEKQHDELSDALSALKDLIDRVTDLDGKLETSMQGFFETASQLKDEILNEKDRSIENLQEQFETEIATLEAAHKSRRGALEQRCDEKLRAIDDHVTKQAAAADKRLAEGRRTREDAWNYERATKEAKALMLLTELQVSTADTKLKAEDLATTEKRLKFIPVSLTSNNTDVKQHGELGAKVIVGFTKESEVQTDKTGAVKELDGQREKIKSLTQKTLKALNRDYKDGYVAVTLQSWEACREYGAGRAMDPLPLEAPDVHKALLRNDSETAHVVLLPPKEANELALIVGGASDVTEGSFQGRSALMKSLKPVSVYAFLVDKLECATAIKEKNRSSFRGFNVLLPIDENLQKSVTEIYYSIVTATYDFILTAWPNSDVLDDKLTVKEWAMRNRSYILLYEKKYWAKSTVSSFSPLDDSDWSI